MYLGAVRRRRTRDRAQFPLLLKVTRRGPTSVADLAGRGHTTDRMSTGGRTRQPGPIELTLAFGRLVPPAGCDFGIDGLNRGLHAGSTMSNTRAGQVKPPRAPAPYPSPVLAL